MRLILPTAIYSSLQALAAAAICMVADSKFGHGCQSFNSFSYSTPTQHRYSPYTYNRVPYYQPSMQQAYYYRQPPRYSWPQQYRSTAPYYGYYSHGQYSPYNYAYSRSSAYYNYNNYGYSRFLYSHRGTSRDRWGNTYAGSRNNHVWITCRTRYCAG